jgi:hypothetical protein
MNVSANLPGLAAGPRFVTAEGSMCDRHLDRPVELVTSADVEPVDFIASMRAASGLSHPAIPPVLDLAVDADGRPYATLALPSGTALPDLGEDALGSEGRLQAASTLAEALAAAHATGVTHGAIVPQRIVISPQGAMLGGWRPWMRVAPAADAAALAAALRTLLGADALIVLPPESTPLDAAQLAGHLRSAVGQRTAAARRAVDRTGAEKRRRPWRAWAAISIVMIAALAGGAVWRWRLAGGSQVWQVSLEREFAQLAAPTDDITMGFWGTGKATAARREAAGHILMRSQEVLQLPAQDGASVRLTAVIEWPERVDGFEVGLRASPDAPRSFWEAPASYMCQFGGYNGRRTFAVAHRREGTPDPPTEVAVPWTIGKRYTVSFEVDRDRLVQRVDGRTVLELFEPIAVGDDSFRNVFLRSWAPSLRIHSLRIERVDEAVRPNPLAAGDALAGAGLHRRAVDAYLRVAEARRGSDIAEQALAKAALAAIGDAAGPALAKDLIARLEAAHPGSVLQRSCEEALAAARYAAGDVEALDLAEEVQKRHPDSYIGEILVRNRPAEPRGADALRLCRLLAKAGQAKVLSLNRMAIADLAPLAPLRLESLYVAGNSIREIAPLAGMPLRTLDISFNPVQSLAPLSGMPLTRIDLSATSVVDLQPLAGSPLTHIGISQTAVADLRPLSGKALNSFTASGSAVSDLTPLRGMAIGWCNIAGTAVSDLAPLSGNPALETLDLTGSKVIDLTPLRGSRLSRLELAWTDVIDLSPLAGMALNFISARSTRISDLSPLAGVKLRHIDLRGSAVRDLSPLAGASLNEAWLPGGRMDLRPLSRQPLALLHIDAPDAVDLSAVAQDRLADLRLREGRAIDLTPLAGSGLVSLDLCGTQVLSFEPILRMPQLATLRLVGARASEGGLDTLAEGLRRQGRRSLARMAEIAHLVAVSDTVRLRELASELPDRRLRLELGLRCGADAARRVAGRLGGRLPVIIDADDHERLLSLLVTADSTWLDLASSSDGRSPLASTSGRPFLLQRKVAVGDLVRAREGGWHLLRARTDISIFGTPKRDAEMLDQGVVVEWDPQ